MRHERFTREEIHPSLSGGATPSALTVYARAPGGTLADAGGRWGVLLLPGGAYQTVAWGEGEPVALALLAAGVQAFVLHYSVAPDRWPQPYLEAGAALAWIRAHGADYGVAPDQVAVCGFSAGGHLAGCLCNFWGDGLLEDRLGLAPGAARPDAAVLCYPVISAGLQGRRESLRNLTGGGPVPHRLSLEHSVGPGHPPTFLWSTWTDASVQVGNTLRYACALEAAGVACECHIFGTGPHAMGTATAESALDEAHVQPHAAAWLPLCVEWLKGVRP